MFIVHVFVHVNSEDIESFISATLANAKSSVKEPGIARFDVLQDRSDPSRFLLVEVYRTNDDPAKHKLTEHYKRWKERVEPMMAAPRRKEVFDNVFPDEEGWD
jgi:quinol monooxygenase YgiN